MSDSPSECHAGAMSYVERSTRRRNGEAVQPHGRTATRYGRYGAGMSIDKVTSPGAIPLDQLVGEGPVVQILWIDAEHPVAANHAREPHRHDYHELFVLADGTMAHR